MEFRTFLAFDVFTSIDDKKEEPLILQINPRDQNISYVDKEEPTLIVEWNTISSVQEDASNPSQFKLHTSLVAGPITHTLDCPHDRTTLCCLLKQVLDGVVAFPNVELPTIDHQGPCKKKFKIRKQDRYLVLVSGRLLVYKTFASKFPTNAIILTAAKISNSGPKAIVVALNKNKHEFLFATRDERDKWAGVLNFMTKDYASRDFSDWTKWITVRDKVPKGMGPQMKQEMKKKNQELLGGSRSNLDSLLSSNKNPSRLPEPIDGQNSAELHMYVENAEKSIGYVEIEGTGATLRDIREVVGELKGAPKEFLFLEGQRQVPREDEEHRPAEAFLPQIVLRDLNPPASDGDDTCMLHIFAEGNPESVGAVEIAKDDVDGATLSEVREVCGDLDGIPEHFVFLKADSIVPRQDEATTRAVHFLPKLIVREVEQDGDAAKMLNIYIEGASESVGAVEISGGGATLLDIREVCGQLDDITQPFSFVKDGKVVDMSDEQSINAVDCIPKILVRFQNQDQNSNGNGGPDLLNIYVEGVSDSVGAVEISDDGATLADIREVCDQLEDITQPFVFVRNGNIVEAIEEGHTAALQCVPAIHVKVLNKTPNMLHLYIEGKAEEIGAVEISDDASTLADIRGVCDQLDAPQDFVFVHNGAPVGKRQEHKISAMSCIPKLILREHDGRPQQAAPPAPNIAPPKVAPPNIAPPQIAPPPEDEPVMGPPLVSPKNKQGKMMMMELNKALKERPAKVPDIDKDIQERQARARAAEAQARAAELENQPKLAAPPPPEPESMPSEMPRDPAPGPPNSAPGPPPDLDSDITTLNIFVGDESVGAVEIAPDDADGATLDDIRDVCDQLDGIPESFVFVRGGKSIDPSNETTILARDCTPNIYIRDANFNGRPDRPDPNSADEVQGDANASMLNIYVEGNGDEENACLGAVEIDDADTDSATLADIRDVCADSLDGVPESFVFVHNGVPVGKRQEEKIMAIECIPDLVLRPKTLPQPKPAAAPQPSVPPPGLSAQSMAQSMAPREPASPLRSALKRTNFEPPEQPTPAIPHNIGQHMLKKTPEKQNAKPSFQQTSPIIPRNSPQQTTREPQPNTQQQPRMDHRPSKASVSVRVAIDGKVIGRVPVVLDGSDGKTIDDLRRLIDTRNIPGLIPQYLFYKNKRTLRRNQELSASSHVTVDFSDASGPMVNLVTDPEFISKKTDGDAILYIWTDSRKKPLGMLPLTGGNADATLKDVRKVVVEQLAGAPATFIFSYDGIPIPHEQEDSIRAIDKIPDIHLKTDSTSAAPSSSDSDSRIMDIFVIGDLKSVEQIEFDSSNVAARLTDVRLSLNGISGVPPSFKFLSNYRPIPESEEGNLIARMFSPKLFICDARRFTLPHTDLLELDVIVEGTSESLGSLQVESKDEATLSHIRRACGQIRDMPRDFSFILDGLTVERHQEKTRRALDAYPMIIVRSIDSNPVVMPSGIGKGAAGGGGSPSQSPIDEHKHDLPGSAPGDKNKLYVMLQNTTKSFGFVDLDHPSTARATLQGVRQVVSSRMKNAPPNFVFLRQNSDRIRPEDEATYQAVNELPRLYIVDLDAESRDTSMVQIYSEGDLSALGDVNLNTTMPLPDARNCIVDTIPTVPTDFIFLSNDNIPIGRKQEKQLTVEDCLSHGQIVVRTTSRQAQPQQHQPPPQQQQIPHQYYPPQMPGPAGMHYSRNPPSADAPMELSITIEGQSNPMGILDIENPQMTLAEVREMMIDELDDVPEDFVFLRDGVPYGRKQEQRKKVSQLPVGQLYIRTKQPSSGENSGAAGAGASGAGASGENEPDHGGTSEVPQLTFTPLQSALAGAMASHK